MSLDPVDPRDLELDVSATTHYYEEDLMVRAVSIFTCSMSFSASFDFPSSINFISFSRISIKF